MKVIVAAAVAFLCIFAALGTVGYIALYEGQRALCPALELATKQPVPYPTDPAKNPSRVKTYQYYLAFKEAESKDHC